MTITRNLPLALIVLVVGLMQTAANGQVTLTIGDVVANAGDTNVCVPVEVAVGGMMHDTVGIELVPPTAAPALSAPTVDTSASIYGSPLVTEIGNNLVVSSFSVSTDDGEVFSLCYDVPAGSEGVTYNIGFTADDGTNDAGTGIFLGTNNLAPAASAGSINVVPEPSGFALTLIPAIVCGLSMRRRRR